ncbi:hypothetical protein VM1G_11360 [Cytospora mali]|uniref:Uncharacterized protein n=1 Tax=Cytospora mali TaxID=578113 RepID=A0A194VS50_CYTMA|nr:hypothetical protein VM1G_11360 [Valsa mali]
MRKRHDDESRSPFTVAHVPTPLPLCTEQVHGVPIRTIPFEFDWHQDTEYWTLPQYARPQHGAQEFPELRSVKEHAGRNLVPHTVLNLQQANIVYGAVGVAPISPDTRLVAAAAA